MKGLDGTHSKRVNTAKETNCWFWIASCIALVSSEGDFGPGNGRGMFELLIVLVGPIGNLNLELESAIWCGALPVGVEDEG